ncbi:MAG: type VII toxin-antitoxin system HepT family RNase toxin [Desulfobacteraceae bacterium]
MRRRSRLERPTLQEQSNCFEKLAACEVISAELSSRLRKMIRFRNILVHRYWEVDDSRILEYARKDLQDLHDLLSAVWTFLGIK